MEKYRKALSEVNIIIDSLPEELNKKIPDKFKKLLEQEKDNNYKPDVNDLVIRSNILSESIVILGLIYRDYLCDDAEKQKLLLIEKGQLQILKDEQEQKYNYENLFKNRIIEEEREKLSLVEVKKKWYTKVIEFFKRKIRGKYNDR